MEPLDPYAPPQAQNLAPKPLGSLAQSARGKEISQAKGILIGIGILLMISSGFLMYNVPNEIDQVIKQENIVDPQQIEEIKQGAPILLYMIYGAQLALGLLFVTFGLIVKKFPLPITITSMVLFILWIVLFGILNPMSLLSGVVIKIVAFVALFRAIKAAREYNAETQQGDLGRGELLA